MHGPADSKRNIYEQTPCIKRNVISRSLNPSDRVTKHWRNAKLVSQEIISVFQTDIPSRALNCRHGETDLHVGGNYSTAGSVELLSPLAFIRVAENFCYFSFPGYFLP